MCRLRSSRSSAIPISRSDPSPLSVLPIFFFRICRSTENVKRVCVAMGRRGGRGARESSPSVPPPVSSAAACFDGWKRREKRVWCGRERERREQLAMFHCQRFKFASVTPPRQWRGRISVGWHREGRALLIKWSSHAMYTCSPLSSAHNVSGRKQWGVRAKKRGGTPVLRGGSSNGFSQEDTIKNYRIGEKNSPILTEKGLKLLFRHVFASPYFSRKWS